MRLTFRVNTNIYEEVITNHNGYITNIILRYIDMIINNNKLMFQYNIEDYNNQKRDKIAHVKIDLSESKYNIIMKIINNNNTTISTFINNIFISIFNNNRHIVNIINLSKNDIKYRELEKLKLFNNSGLKILQLIFTPSLKVFENSIDSIYLNEEESKPQIYETVISNFKDIHLNNFIVIKKELENYVNSINEHGEYNSLTKNIIFNNYKIHKKNISINIIDMKDELLRSKCFDANLFYNCLLDQLNVIY